MLSGCGICFFNFDAVVVLPVLLKCGHIFCNKCVEAIIRARQPCPLRCFGPLRFRDTRESEVSIVPTDATKSAGAVADALDAEIETVALLSSALKTVISEGTRLLGCVTNQEGTLGRIACNVTAGLEHRAFVLTRLATQRGRVAVALEMERDLDSAIHEAQVKLQALLDEAEHRPPAALTCQTPLQVLAGVASAISHAAASPVPSPLTPPTVISTPVSEVSNLPSRAGSTLSRSDSESTLSDHSTSSVSTLSNVSSFLSALSPCSSNSSLGKRSRDSDSEDDTGPSSKRVQTL